MTIDIKTLIDNRNYCIEEVDKLFLLGVLLHTNNIITTPQLLGILKKVRTKKVPFKNTYRCNINKKWYNDMLYTEILHDILTDNRHTSTLDFESLLKYVNLLTNKTKNYNIDWVKYQLILPYTPNSNYFIDPDYIENRLIDLKNIFDIKIDFTSYNSYDSYGYCCEDCDGDFESYRRSNWLFSQSFNKTNYTEIIDNKLKPFRNKYERNQ